MSSEEKNRTPYSAFDPETKEYRPTVFANVVKKPELGNKSAWRTELQRTGKKIKPIQTSIEELDRKKQNLESSGGPESFGELDQIKLERKQLQERLETLLERKTRCEKALAAFEKARPRAEKFVDKIWIDYDQICKHFNAILDSRAGLRQQISTIDELISEILTAANQYESLAGETIQPQLPFPVDSRITLNPIPPGLREFANLPFQPMKEWNRKDAAKDKKKQVRKT